MNQHFGGSFQFFRAFGIQVHVHWTWFLLFLFLVRRDRGFEAPGWNVAVVLAIFGIVLLHEFGHSLACRSVGGRADHIMLWPLGGVAFVQPPHHPGAVLWSIVAGPLVNVLLAPVFFGAMILLQANVGEGDVVAFAEWLFLFNLIIFVFNMLPIYPLDGGQILHALLWYVLGWATSLRIAAGIGLVVAVLGGAWALWMGDAWFLIIAVFIAWQAWIGWQRSRQLTHEGPDKPDTV